MLKRLLRSRIAAFERRYDYDMTYAREILDFDRGAFMDFSRVARLAGTQISLPSDALFTAKLVTALHDDCGPCTQLVVRMAEEARVPAATLRAILMGEQSGMTEDVRLAWRFAHAVLVHATETDTLRAQIASRWGARAPISLALAIAGNRIFPTVKYAMGHGRTCQRVHVAGADLQLRNT